ncbi:aqualysin-1-like [Ptychodera flava]|uniref:aqualysin-1-like n=1 Tax=Ptychodera flava TaxID=63121 RepID=UPI003969D29D
MNAAALKANLRNNQKFLYSLHAVSGDGTGVNVYIIDTGIRITHIDFDGRAQFFYDALRGNGNDCNGHGTHCAGTAAGSSYGVAKSASLWAVRVLSCIGFGSNSEVIDGIDQVASFGITPGVASMSLGGSISISLDNTVNILKNAGFTVVVAAGNSNDDACNYSPSRSASAITVGATTTRDSRATYSNYGLCVDIFAPGSDITSAWHTADDATNTISGTSMACPHVAGAAAVLLGMDPSMSHEAVKAQLLQESSIDKVTLPGSNSPNTLLFIG